MKINCGEHELVRYRACSQCGKVFPIYCEFSNYGYSLEWGRKIFCSYRCMRAYERPRLEKANEKKTGQFDQAANDEKKGSKVYK